MANALSFGPSISLRTTAFLLRLLRLLRDRLLGLLLRDLRLDVLDLVRCDLRPDFRDLTLLRFLLLDRLRLPLLLLLFEHRMSTRASPATALGVDPSRKSWLYA